MRRGANINPSIPTSHPTPRTAVVLISPAPYQPRTLHPEPNLPPRAKPWAEPLSPGLNPDPPLQLYVMTAVHTLPFLYCSNGVCHAYRGFPLFDGKVNSRQHLAAVSAT